MEKTMIKHLSLKAYGKINLGLDVLRRREDGYHDVRMIMQTVGILTVWIWCGRKNRGLK